MLVYFVHFKLHTVSNVTCLRAKKVQNILTPHSLLDRRSHWARMREWEGGCSAMPQGHCAELTFCVLGVCLAIKSKSKEINGLSWSSAPKPFYPNYLALLSARSLVAALHPPLNCVQRSTDQTTPNATCFFFHRSLPTPEERLIVVW